MADPAYIVNGTLTDGEAWVAISSAQPSSADVQFVSTDDGQVGDFSQYMDLVIICYARGVASGTWKDIRVTFNNDTASNYANEDLYGDGSSTGVQQTTPAYTGLAYIAAAGASANVFSAVIYNIFDINSGKYKCCNTVSAAQDGNPDIIWTETGTWKSQAAITEIDLVTTSGFAAGSRFDLFGVLPRMVA